MNKKRWLAVAIAVVLFVISIAIPKEKKESEIPNSQMDYFKNLAFGDNLIRESIVEPGSPDSKIVILKLNGVISSNESSSLFSPEGYNHKFFLEQLEEISKDDAVNGVLFVINSPGGGVYESAQIRDKIVQLRKDKGIKFYVAMENLAASGGYYVAAETDKIFAAEETWTGSIGVISQVVNVQGLMEKYGVQVHTYSSGDMKAMGSPYKAPSEKEVAIWNELINEAYDKFVKIISEGRNLPIDQVRVLADGRIYSAKQAKNVGLVDEIGYTEDALKALKEENNLEGAQVITYSKGLDNPFSKLLSEVKSIAKTPSELSELKELMNIENNIPTLYYLYGGK